MDRKEKIKKIYEVIADKTLSFGCRVKHKDWTIFTSTWMWWGMVASDKIIWHPVMLWDVLGYFTDEAMHSTLNATCELKLLWLWLYKREPIDEQSPNCVNFIYSLIN